MQSNMDMYGNIIHLYSSVTYLPYIFFIGNVRGANNDQYNVAMHGVRSHFLINFTCTFILLVSSFLSGLIKRTYCVCFITFGSIHIKYVHYGLNFKADISYYLYHVLVLYFSYYCMCQLYNYFEDGKVL